MRDRNIGYWLRWPIFLSSIFLSKNGSPRPDTPCLSFYYPEWPKGHRKKPVD